MKTVKTDLSKRMPDKLGKSGANTWWEFRSALMAIIAFHVGKLSGGIACDRLCRALDMTSYEQRPQAPQP
jgi:hypothetical protein